MDINVTKTQNKITPYNYKALTEILSTCTIDGKGLDNDESKPSVSDSDTTQPPGDTENKPKAVDNSWRDMPPTCMEEMIIASYGDEYPPSLNIARKIHDNTIEDKEIPLLARKELDIIMDKFNASVNVLKVLCTDFPRAQFSREYYLDRMKQFLTQNKNEGACIWYTGNSEVGTGNWCFKDGVITFENVFGLYLDHFKGKRLTLICDCSYSGQWVVDAVNKMDEIGIPSCGHHTREQGILLKVFASCLPKEEASMLAYSESITIKDDKHMLSPLPGKKLESGQTPYYGDFRSIRCRKQESESCEIDSTCTWKDRIITSLKNVYLVRGKDEGKEAWHFVLVDEEKLEVFKVKVASGQINVADYGKVLFSGWGKDPPQEKHDIIDKKYLRFIYPKKTA